MVRKTEDERDPLRCPCCSIGAEHTDLEHERHLQRWCEEHQRWCGGHEKSDFEARMERIKQELLSLKGRAA